MLFFNSRQYAEQKYNRLVRRLKYARIIDALDDQKELIKEFQVRYNKTFSVR